MLSFDEKITIIVNALNDAGYEPYAQLQGYLLTNDDTYITRRNNARTLVRELDKRALKKYLRTVL